MRGIAGVGLATPLGGREDFAAAWARGEAAAPEVDGCSAGKLPLRGGYPQARALLRRLDRTGGLLAAAAADLGAELGAQLGEGTDLAVGTDLATSETTFEFLGRIGTHGARHAHPQAFPNLVPGSAAGQLGLLRGWRGAAATFVQHGVCADEAVAWAAGRCGPVVAGGAEGLGPVRSAATARVGDGQLRGEGGAVVAFLGEAEGGRRVWCELGFDPGGRAFGPPSAGAVGRVVDGALERASVGRSELGAIVASSPALTETLGLRCAATDHAERVGVHGGDGAFRVALAWLLLERDLPVNRAGARLGGPAVLVVGAGRGGAIVATVVR